MSNKTSQNVGGLERIAKIPIVINGNQVDIPLPQRNNRYFKLREIGPSADGYICIIVVYRGPSEPNGYKTFGKDAQAVQPDEVYRLSDEVTKLHFSK